MNMEAMTFYLVTSVMVAHMLCCVVFGGSCTLACIPVWDRVLLQYVRDPILLPALLMVS